VDAGWSRRSRPRRFPAFRVSKCHLTFAMLAADPPCWPARTTAASLLAIDVDVTREGLLASLGPLQRRLEFLDYPGEWLLDLPLLGQDFATWSDATLRRLEAPENAKLVRPFMAFVRGLPRGVAADETLAVTGHRLYTDALRRIRDERGLTFLQPGRFLMPPPGAAPPWTHFFPLPGAAPLASLMGARFDAYSDAVRGDLVSPMFGNLERLIVLADLLSALNQGPAAFADVQLGLAAAADVLRWNRSWIDWLGAFARLELPSRSIGRVAFAATKADHIATRQRGNLHHPCSRRGRRVRGVCDRLGPLYRGCCRNTGRPSGFSRARPYHRRGPSGAILSR
jgi:predicted YcjX-like family ATPase